MSGDYARLTIEELLAYRNNRSLQQGGSAERFYCPIHKSDKQRSLIYNTDSGWFYCFAEQCKGFIEHKRQEWMAARRMQPQAIKPKTLFDLEAKTKPQNKVEAVKEYVVRDCKDTIPEITIGNLVYQAIQNLPGSLGQTYLESRGISLEIAQQYTVGYASNDLWPGRSAKHGRLSFPLTWPDGIVISAYGRAVKWRTEIPRTIAHDVLRGSKAYFNARALNEPKTVYITEGVFDALSLISAGYLSTCAIIGLGNLRWDLVKAERTVLCLDGDKAASDAVKRLLADAIRYGKKAFTVDPSVLKGHKDFNELWVSERRIQLEKPEIVVPIAATTEMEKSTLEVVPAVTKPAPIRARAVNLLRNYNWHDEDTV